VPSLAGGLGSLTPLLTQDLRPGLICIVAPRLGSLCRARSGIDSRSSTRADDSTTRGAGLPPRARTSGGSRFEFANPSLRGKKEMPATTYSPTHFRVQYNGPAGLEALRRRERAFFCAREPSAEILSVPCQGSLAVALARRV
jgi:hypothetical protein